MRRILLALTLLILGCSVSEFVSRQMLANRYPTIKEWKYSRPAAYANSIYWSPEFLDEYYAIPLKPNYEDGTIDIGDFTGRWFNVRDGIRVTTDQPANALHTMYLFGASTAVNLEVPDNMTLASYLQRLVGDKYKVVNISKIVQGSTQHLERLKTVSINVGDVVIWYVGFVDTLSVYFTGYNKAQAAYNTSPCGISYMVYTLVSFVCDQPRIDAGSDEIEASLERMMQRYTRNAAEARIIIEAAGATFYQVLEPHIYSKTLSVYEQTIVDNPKLTLIGLEPIILQAYTHLREVKGIIDLTHAVDALRASGVEIYLDDHHFTEKGLAIVARALANAISE